MDRDSRKVTEEAWLICPNWTEVRRFTKNKNNKDKYFEYMFVDSGIVVGANGDYTVKSSEDLYTNNDMLSKLILAYEEKCVNECIWDVNNYECKKNPDYKKNNNNNNNISEGFAILQKHRENATLVHVYS